jgi:hypothetical protein
MSDISALTGLGGIDSLNSDISSSTLPSTDSIGTLLSAAANNQSSFYANANSLLSGANSTGSQATGNFAIPQTERLFTTRPRYLTLPTDGGDRGTRAYIRLMSNNPTQSAARAGLPSSLQGTGNPLSQALNGGTYNGYAEFLVTDLRCPLDEKIQIHETFGDGEVVYYFGRQPMFFSISGILIDSPDNSWFVDWLNMYGHVMRGSQLAQNYELLSLVLPNMTLVGTIPHMSWSQNSSNDAMIQFEFQFQVKQLTPTPVVSLGTPLSNSANLINFSTADSFLSQQGINSIKSQTSAALSVIQNPNSSVSQIGASLTSLGSGLSGSMGNYYSSSDNSSSLYSTVTTSIGSVTNTLNSVQTSLNDVFYSVSANLAGIRASIFAPIYGVLSSLTKLVAAAGGDVASVFNAISSDVASVVRDVENVASQALGILSIINATATDVGLAIGSVEGDVSTALSVLSNTVGCITTIPYTALQSFRAAINAGQISATIGFMSNPPIAALSYSSGNLPSKIALLNSGPVPTAQSGATL